MSASVHVTGIRPATPEYTKKLRAYEACLEAGVDPPKALRDYFGDVSKPNPKGMEVDIEMSGAVTKVEKMGMYGYDVELDKLPEGVKILRCYLAY